MLANPPNGRCVRMVSHAGVAMTLEEVAALAGVSRSTVSRVVNDQPRVSSATRAQVRRVISEHGYSPNLAARTLAGRRSQTIGVVIPAMMQYSIASPYYALIMQGVTTACDQRDFNVMLSPATKLTPEGYERIMRSGVVDGVVVTSTAASPALLNWLAVERYPFVLIGYHPAFPNINTVCPDYEQAGMMAAQHLIWLGYERIATITGPQTHPGAMARHGAFLHGFEEAHRAVPPAYIVEADFTEHGGHQAMQQLLNAAPQPQAVFCGSDLTAIGALQAIRGAGLRVPDDIALVGFDDIPQARTVEPPLTTVRQPMEQLGHTAVSMLIDILESLSADHHRQLAPQHVLLPTELVVRESCGQKQRFWAQRPARGADVASAQRG